MIDLDLTATSVEVMEEWADSPDMLTPDVVAAVDVWGRAAKAVLGAEPRWKCVTHECDVPDVSHLFKEVTFDPAKEHCAIDGEWGQLRPENCEIVRGVFVRVKE